MTPEFAKLLLPIVTAISEGKDVQKQFTYGENKTWYHLKDRYLNPYIYTYRIKQPRPWFRIALFKTQDQSWCGIACTKEQEHMFVDQSFFIKWLTERKEYDPLTS